jgi:serine/threonine-protein kinase HipA
VSPPDARYIQRSDAIAVYLPDLPLVSGPQLPRTGTFAGCIRDAAPDGWGQRVIENRFAGSRDLTGELGLRTYLLESGSNRIGALDFQRSPTEYVARHHQTIVTLAELLESADRLEAGIPLSPELDDALLRGTSVGGSRPKATLLDGDRQMIAKFSSTTDTAAVVQYEYVGMELARRCGLDVAPVEIVDVLNRSVLPARSGDPPPVDQVWLLMMP